VEFVFLKWLLIAGWRGLGPGLVQKVVRRVDVLGIELGQLSMVRWQDIEKARC